MNWCHKKQISILLHYRRKGSTNNLDFKINKIFMISKCIIFWEQRVPVLTDPPLGALGAVIEHYLVLCRDLQERGAGCCCLCGHVHKCAVCGRGYSSGLTFGAGRRKILKAVVCIQMFLAWGRLRPGGGVVLGRWVPICGILPRNRFSGADAPESSSAKSS